MDFNLILDLRKEPDAQRKGYLFETVIREIFPWSHRPPISMIAKSEQLDAFFEWNSWHFLVEAKAKEGVITPGSHDWEDFELKIRKRRGSVIGLFCTLYPVTEEIFQTARGLNEQGIFILVFDGKFWDEMAASQLNLEIVLRHSVQLCRATFDPRPKSLDEVKKWAVDQAKEKVRINALSSGVSGSFLRRNAHLRHSDLYVNRSMDRYAAVVLGQLKPSRLQKVTKQKLIDGKMLETVIECPKQIIVIRDKSGSGKTTFGVNTLLRSDGSIAIGKSATEPNSDSIIDFIDQISNKGDYGIGVLRELDSPLVYLIDSLDEAKGRPSLGAELKAIFDHLTKLNESAKLKGLRCFPVLLIFTVRDEYWRDFESIFEGRRELKRFTNMFSQFTKEEFQIALENYSKAYTYSYPADFPDKAYSALGSPFNLMVFSEASQFTIIPEQTAIFEEDVLDLYFSKKRENVIKRPIHGFTDKAFMSCCSRLAFGCIGRNSRMFRRLDLLNDIKQATGFAEYQCHEIGLFLISEQIVKRDSGGGEFGFRHGKFLEYLIAYYIAEAVEDSGSIKELQDSSQRLSETEVASAVTVNGLVLYISKKDFPDSHSLIEKYYTGSHEYMARYLLDLRSSLAGGEIPSRSAFTLVLKGSTMADPQVSWDAFFAIASKASNQPPETVFAVFELAWKRNRNSHHRWKLLSKLAEHDLILYDKTLRLLEMDYVAKEWEVYLGIALNKCFVDAVELVCAVIDRKKLNQICMTDDQDWRGVIYMLSCIDGRRVFELGAPI